MARANEFEYSAVKNRFIMVVSFSGELSEEVQDVAILKTCQSEVISESEIKFVVFDFSKVNKISLGVIPGLAQLQREIRLKGLEIRIASMGKEIREKLIKLGVIRQSELSGNLKEALIGVGRRSVGLGPERPRKAG